MGSGLAGGVGGNIGFCFRDSDFQADQGEIRIEEMVFADFTTLGCPGLRQLWGSPWARGRSWWSGWRSSRKSLWWARKKYQNP